MKNNKKIVLFVMISSLMIGYYLIVRLINKVQDIRPYFNKNEQVLNQKIRDLENTNFDLNQRIKYLTNESGDKNKRIEELNKRINDLTSELTNTNELLNKPDFHVSEEKLFVKNPQVLLPNSMSIQQVKALLGQPSKIEEGTEAHGSGIVVTLTYDEASFTFNKDGDKEGIKWYTIKSPYFITNRGITVGSGREEVKHQYGNGYMMYVEDEGEITIGEKQGISFKFENDIVKEISV